MDGLGHLSVEVCDSGLVCCSAGMLDSPRDDFEIGNTDVFSGSMIHEVSIYRDRRNKIMEFCNEGLFTKYVT